MTDSKNILRENVEKVNWLMHCGDLEGSSLHELKAHLLISSLATPLFLLCFHLTALLYRVDSWNRGFHAKLETYRWQELPQVTFLSQQKFCRDKHMFVSKSNIFCCNKIMLVVTKLLSWQNYVCHNNTFVVIKLLLWQAYFCRDKNDTCGSSHKWSKSHASLLTSFPSDDRVVLCWLLE